MGALENVSGAPFCADVETSRTQTLNDGNRIRLQRTEHICRDSQGRTRREMVPPTTVDGTPRGPILLTTIFDPVAGVAITLNPRQHAAWTRATRVPGSVRPGVAPSRAADIVINHTAPQSADVTEEDLGEDSVNGFVAKGTRISQIVPAGERGNEQPMTIVSERWYSEALKSFVRGKQSDPRSGETISELTNVATGEPDPALFQIPSDYTIEDPPNLRSGPVKHPPNLHPPNER
jgi:hypothetical protein